ncbi:phosphopantetheine-binding protein [Oerskovia sp. M15]
MAVLGTRPTDENADFFQLGGGSLAAAQLVSRIRVRAPEFTMADIYDLPRLRRMADAVEAAVSVDEGPGPSARRGLPRGSCSGCRAWRASRCSSPGRAGCCGF